MRFWLDRGACGFRMDVINHISKVMTYPDAPTRSPGSKYQPGYAKSAMMISMPAIYIRVSGTTSTPMGLDCTSSSKISMTRY